MQSSPSSQVLKDGMHQGDLTEVAKLFTLHGDPVTEEDVTS